MTTQSITDRVRRLIQDTDSQNYHWSDEQIKTDIQFAIRALHKERPETRYVGGSVVDCVMLPAEDSAEIEINDRYEECIVYYAAHLAYSDDCTDPVSKQLADDFLGKFKVHVRM